MRQCDLSGKFEGEVVRDQMYKVCHVRKGRCEMGRGST